MDCQSCVTFPKGKKHPILLTSDNNEGPYDIRLKPNFKLFMYGPSHCGKTDFIGELLKNLDVITMQLPRLVVYVYKVMQPKYEKTTKVVSYLVCFEITSLHKHFDFFGKRHGFLR